MQKKKGDKSVFDNPSMVTFSGLLNAIDGIASQEGRNGGVCVVIK